MGFFDSPSDRGKKDGTIGNKDFISYAIDKDYRRGYDRGQGLKDGSKQSKDHDEHPISSAFADALTGRETWEKLGKSDDYKKGYDRGKETYGRDTTFDTYSAPKIERNEQQYQGGQYYSGGYSDSGKSNGRGLNGGCAVTIIVLWILGSMGSAPLLEPRFHLGWFWWAVIIGGAVILGAIFACFDRD